MKKSGKKEHRKLYSMKLDHHYHTPFKIKWIINIGDKTHIINRRLLSVFNSFMPCWVNFIYNSSTAARHEWDFCCCVEVVYQQPNLIPRLMSRINVNFYYAFITFIKFYDRTERERNFEHVLQKILFFYFQERKEKKTLRMNNDWTLNVKVKRERFLSSLWCHLRIATKKIFKWKQTTDRC